LRRRTDAAGTAARYRAIVQPRRWIERVPGRPWVADGLLGLAVGVVSLASLVVSGGIRSGQTIWRPLDGLGYLLLAVGPLALVARRRWPLGVLAVVEAASTVYSARTYPESGTGLAVFVALYTVAALERRRVVAAVTVAAVVLGVVSEVVFYGDSMVDGEPLYVAVVVLAAVSLGEAVRNRRAYVAELRDRAERAERTREEEARRRVADERLRIARELHDVVSHTIGVISVQAGVAAHLLHRRPDKAADSLAAIRQASDEALGELHAMLGVLREGDGDAGAAPLTPAPGMAELDALVAQAAGAGVEVRVAVEGEPRRLPPAVDLACYRVVQESLTNVVRHADASRAEITVTHHDGGVVVEITDDGRGAAANGRGAADNGAESAGGRRSIDSDRQDRRSGRSGRSAGQGIVGMQERARALGGTLEAGPRPGGGFRVQASLPVGGT
jgi:signal transduction histidine kinase